MCWLIYTMIMVEFIMVSFFLSASYLLAMRNYQHYEFKRKWKFVALQVSVYGILGVYIVWTSILRTAGFFGY